jgi:2-polyprenyl-6-methoxyphenol hydroxylase-like FAD-dependent oxidoreductase
MSLGSPRSVLARASSDADGQGLTAVVLGAGIAGLCSAHVLCRHFERVVLVEGDVVAPPTPNEGENRAETIMQVGAAQEVAAGRAGGTDAAAALAPQCRWPSNGVAYPSCPTRTPSPWEGWRPWRRCCRAFRRRQAGSVCVCVGGCLILYWRFITSCAHTAV